MRYASKTHSLCKKDTYCCKECQKLAWKAGHKRECEGKGKVGGAGAPPHIQAALQQAQLASRSAQPVLTPKQSKGLIGNIRVLYAAQDWRGLVALAPTAGAAATQVRESKPDRAIMICTMIGESHQELGQFQKVINTYCIK